MSRAEEEEGPTHRQRGEAQGVEGVQAGGVGLGHGALGRHQKGRGVPAEHLIFVGGRCLLEGVGEDASIEGEGVRCWRAANRE